MAVGTMARVRLTALSQTQIISRRRLPSALTRPGAEEMGGSVVSPNYDTTKHAHAQKITKRSDDAERRAHTQKITKRSGDTERRRNGGFGGLPDYDMT